MRVHVDKVDGARACGGDDSKIIALWKQGIERTKSIGPRVVATGDVCLGTESWFQRNGREPVTGFRCHSPCPDICGTEAAKLPKRFVIEIPTGFRLSDGMRDTHTDAVAHFLADTSVEGGGFSVKAKVVRIQREVLFERSDTVHAPKSDGVVGGIIKKSGLIQVRSHGEAVNLPRADAGLYLESVKTQADIWALPHIDQTP